MIIEMACRIGLRSVAVFVPVSGQWLTAIIAVIFSLLPWSCGVFGYMCPTGDRGLQLIQSATPYGNASAGRYVSHGELPLVDCVRLCCAAAGDGDATATCHTVFHYDGHCLLIRCASQRLCEPLPRSGAKFRNYFVVNVRMVVDDDDGTVAAAANFNSVSTVQLEPFLPFSVLPDEPGDEFGRYLDFPLTSERLGPHERSSENVKTTLPLSRTASKVCDLAGPPGECAEGEQCLPKNNRARQGFCVCDDDDNWFRDEATGRCVRSPTDKSIPSAADSVTADATSTTPSSAKADDNQTSSTKATVDVVTTVTPRRLIVSAGEDKELRLPTNSGTLSAYAIVTDGAQPSRYEWSLVAHPPGDDIGVVRDKNTATVKFSGLKEGLYKFKVTVSNEVASGEAFVSVTVLPPKRINKPPVAAINPVNQTVKLPNTDVVLDGSMSTDDGGISSYAWEVTTAPIDYSIASLLTNTATLQLKNLVPGFYTFMLTVTDTDGIKNSTYANVVVIKETDYPPTANAGPDVIVYLPRNEVTLNGSLSSDDKGIKSWEWTKGTLKAATAVTPAGEKAVDMQDTRTPLLHLSNLDVGMYTFVLRVTDTADQSSTSEVHVFVKPGKEGPFADAGPDQTIALPTTSVMLDGSRSHDDIGITRWEWKQVSGPSQTAITDANRSKATASRLNNGVYVFQLTVYDENGATNTNTTAVTVIHSLNGAPKANAGGDLTVVLPRNMVALNGSLSTDDVGIVGYAWSRDPSSLAVGEIVEGSDHRPLLMLTGLLPGRYLFKLTVTDAEGLSDSDTASLIVQSATGEKDDVEMKIASDILSFSEEQKITLSKKLALLLQDEAETNVVVTHMSMERNTRHVFLIFHAEKVASPATRPVVLNGPGVVRVLRHRLRMDAGLLGVPVLSIDTVVCQNNCSGHGSCDPYTKQCVCEAFWMEDVLRAQFLGGDGESNCDWSVLYVIIFTILGLVVFVIVTWSLVCLCNRRHKSSSRFRLPPKLRRHRRRHRYTLLDERNASDNGNVGIVVPLAGKRRNDSVMASDSDLSESDTVFDKSKKSGLDETKLIKQPSNTFRTDDKLPDQNLNELYISATD